MPDHAFSEEDLKCDIKKSGERVRLLGVDTVYDVTEVGEPQINTITGKIAVLKN